jgi:Ca-activated chloride channel family protein
MKPNLILEHEMLAVESEQDVHVMVELTAPPRDAAATRPPLNLALVLDRSGSMAGEKLDVTKACAAFLAQRLAADDRLAVVTFDDAVDLVAAMGPVSASVLEAIGRIGPGGMTNLSGGWLEGVAQLRAAGGNGRVLLLTDGQANQGITDTERLLAMTGQAATGGVSTTTIGFGADFNEELLTGMADAGGAGAHFAESPEDVPAIFDAEFEGLVQLVAQNVAVEIRPTGDVEMVAVLNDYPSQGIPGGVRVQLGDAYAETVRRIVLRLHVPALQQLGAATIAEIVVHWAEPTDAGAKLHTVTLPLTVNLVSADEAAAQDPDARVRHEVLLLEAAKALDEAKRDADEGRFGDAQQRLASSAAVLRAAMPAAPMAAEMTAFADKIADGEYDAAERKRWHYAAHRSRRGGPPPMVSE